MTNAYRGEGLLLAVGGREEVDRVSCGNCRLSSCSRCESRRFSDCREPRIAQHVSKRFSASHKIKAKVAPGDTRSYASCHLNLSYLHLRPTTPPSPPRVNA